jgi:hypothetical protein
VTNAPREPTPEECTNHAGVDGGWAGWYPQMGGYVGRCVAVPADEPCWDVWIWHDGEFPFSGEDARLPDFSGQPRCIHHCDPGQFVDFGEWLQRLPA